MPGGHPPEPEAEAGQEEAVEEEAEPWGLGGA